MTAETCENACQHVVKQKQTEKICNLPLLHAEDFNDTSVLVPRWGYDTRHIYQFDNFFIMFTLQLILKHDKTLFQNPYSYHHSPDENLGRFFQRILE